MSVFEEIQNCQRRGEAAVLVTIAEVRGSAPRGAGTRLLVTFADITGTIGGGALEHAAIAHARELLREDSFSARVQMRDWTLGKTLSQCCGGKVSLVFDRIPACDFHIEIFGAGHVAQQMSTLLRQLPCRATFHDSRGLWLDRIGADAESAPRQCARPDIDLGARQGPATGPGMLRTRCHGENVHEAVEACRPAAFFLVMTHSHERDLDVVEAVLAREDAAFCGLIASRSKARAFRSRLSRKGFSDTELEQLTAPLGKHLRTGNTPMEVAIAAVADVLDTRTRAQEKGANTSPVLQGPTGRGMQPGIASIDPGGRRTRPGR